MFGMQPPESQGKVGETLKDIYLALCHHAYQYQSPLGRTEHLVQFLSF